MGDVTCGSSIDQTQKKVTRVHINKVSNGFTIEGFNVDTKIANTLAEALELARKELE